MEKNTIGERIRALRCHYNLGVKEFASRCNLSHVAVFQIESGRTVKPHRSSVARMARIFGSSTDWILYGRDEMLPNGRKDLDEEGEAHWKEEAYHELRSRNILLEKEVERLWSMLSHFTNVSGRDYRMLDVG